MTLRKKVLPPCSGSNQNNQQETNREQNGDWGQFVSPKRPVRNKDVTSRKMVVFIVAFSSCNSEKSEKKGMTSIQTQSLHFTSRRPSYECVLSSKNIFTF
jgi:hypothetical protein